MGRLKNIKVPESTPEEDTTLTLLPKQMEAYAALTDIGPGAFAFGGEEAPAVNVPAGSAAAKALSEG